MVFINVFFTATLFPNSIAYLGGASTMLMLVIGAEFMIMGAFNALLNTPIQTNMQKLIPNKLRSRVNSVSMVISQGGVPVGAVIYGILLDVTKVHYIYTVISILFTILTIGFLLVAPAGVYEPKGTDATKNSNKVAIDSK